MSYLKFAIMWQSGRKRDQLEANMKNSGYRSKRKQLLDLF
jgi:hypothetical protein